MNSCNNICERYRTYKKRVPYTSGLIAYCKNCRYIYYKEDVKTYRCPCCKTILRTHKRTSKNEKEVKRIG